MTSLPEPRASLGDESQWPDRALCATDPNPDRWVDLPPIRVRGRANPDYDKHLADLKHICGMCEVARECLSSALRVDVRGVFAGTDEYERADLREEFGLLDPEPVTHLDTDEDARQMTQRFTALRLARRGLSNAEIALELGVSTMTVSRIMSAYEQALTETVEQTGPPVHAHPPATARVAS